MAWVKVKDCNNKIYEIPNSVFKNSYEGCGVFSRIEPEQKPKTKNIKSEVKENGDTEIQLSEQIEVDTKRKNSKKTSV